MRANSNHFLTFAALARMRSFSGAANLLGLPASTISNHIAALEQFVGVQLVMRTTRRTRLTEFGERFALRCRALADLTEETTAFLLTEKTEPAGALRISVPFTFAYDLVAPVIGRFSQAYPKIQIELVLNNERIDLIEQNFDLAIRVGPLQDSTLTRQYLGQARRHLVASRDYLNRAGRPQNPEDLAALCFIGHAFDTRLELQGPAGKIDIKLQPQTIANDPKTICGMAEAGGGIAALPRFLTAQGISNGTLETILPEFTLAPVDLSIVHYGYSARNLNISIFSAFLIKELAAIKSL